MKHKESFLVNRLKSVVFALKGMLHLYKAERSIKIQIAITLVFCALGFYYQISAYEWLAQLLCFALIISLEGMNTAIEEIANFIHPEKHYKIGLIKDIAAGSVLIAAIFAVIIGLIIYIPKLF